MKNNINSRQTWFRMFVEITTGLIRARFWSGISSEILTPVEVKNDFFGINIATSDDPACDDYVVKSLQDLGIKQLRMNFSYESFDGRGERLLERILAEGFDILLNVFPSIEGAASLANNQTAAQNWQNFVEKVFATYHDKVIAFEIGNTSNRQRWSGFSPISYLNAWQIASPLADQYDIELAGPNVSDFEPVYNMAYLNEMKRLHKVPAIHTDNLFVERVIEPENYDHRVFGKHATKLLKLNLIKKARIIDAIGKRLGALKTFCTYNCWTVKRLSRKSIDPEQKQADYLTRYLVIAAASGALDKVYWGALICNRDGMIDCGSATYPDYENVSYYRQVRGDVKDFRNRPSFDAYKCVIAQLSSTRCIQGITADNGINHFIFEGQQYETHVTWCKDGYALPLSAIYPKELHNVVVFDVLGKQLAELPRHITEQPIFIQFSTLQTSSRPSAKKIKSLADLNKKNVAVAIELPQQFEFFNNTDWAGALMFDNNLPADVVIKQLLPEQIEKLPLEKILRDTRNKVWNVKTELGMLTVKLNRAKGLKKLSYRFLESKGKRHWNNAVNMLRRGVNTPLPVAFFERHQNTGTEQNYYITQFLEGAFSARDVFTSINNGEADFNGMSHDHLLKVIAEFTCDMHNSGVLHRDLSSGNLLLVDEGENITPYLIDIGRAQVRNHIKRRQRLIDVMRICYKLPWPGREQLMAYYIAHLGRELPRWRLAVHYYVFKQKSKRFIKGNIKKAWKKVF
jgi:tRNA A-37 threonylcarbamoyl transferase component Bud32